MSRKVRLDKLRANSYGSGGMNGERTELPLESTSGVISKESMRKALADLRMKALGQEIAEQSDARVRMDVKRIGGTATPDEAIGIENSSKYGFWINGQKFSIGEVKNGAFARAVVERRKEAASTARDAGEIC